MIKANPGPLQKLKFASHGNDIVCNNINKVLVDCKDEEYNIKCTILPLEPFCIFISLDLCCVGSKIM